MKPYINWEGLVRCPYHWEDDVAHWYDNKINLKEVLLHIENYAMIAFHPINIFLNTESLEHYESARKYFHNYLELKRFRNDSTCGSCNTLRDVLACV